jgi:hypothetical protein
VTREEEEKNLEAELNFSSEWVESMWGKRNWLEKPVDGGAVVRREEGGGGLELSGGGAPPADVDEPPTPPPPHAALLLFFLHHQQLDQWSTRVTAEKAIGHGRPPRKGKEDDDNREGMLGWAFLTRPVNF